MRRSVRKEWRWNTVRGHDDARRRYSAFVMAHELISRSDGDGSSKSIPHAYTLKKNAWYAVYEVSSPGSLKPLPFRIRLVACASLFPEEEEHKDVFGRLRSGWSSLVRGQWTSYSSRLKRSVMKVHRGRELGDRETQSLSLLSELETGEDILLSDSGQLGGREPERLRRFPEDILLKLASV